MVPQASRSRGRQLSWKLGGPGVTGGQALPVGIFRQSSHFLPAFKSWF